MKADLTRDSFEPFKHYSRVLMQQGRVQLDADWNEQGALLVDQLRTALTDLAGPIWIARNAAFALPGSTGSATDFLLPPLDLYVDGILCSLSTESTPVAASGKTLTVQRWSLDGRSFAKGDWVRVYDGSVVGDQGALGQVASLDYAKGTLTLAAALPDNSGGSRPMLQRLLSYLTQPDLPDPAPLESSDANGADTAGGLLYLDVWERAVTAYEDDDMREVALNGPDTAARVRTVVQARLYPQPRPACLTQDALSVMLDGTNGGLLRARAQPTNAATDPCIVSPDAGYRGSENQLYRVEVHQGGTSACSFKWSRENGSVLFAVQSVTGGNDSVVVALANLGRDDRFGLAVGDIVELQNDVTVLAPHVPMPLLAVQAIDRDNLQVTLSGTIDNPDVFTSPGHAVLRRWDHGAGTLGSDSAIAIPMGDTATADLWIDLEDGVQVQFLRIDDGLQYRTGDYWLIPARVATGSVLWPQDSWTGPKGVASTGPSAQPPRGVVHHYAPLATLGLTDGALTLQKSCLQTKR